MLITNPPIKFPCYAGIDFPSQEELATFTQGKEYSDNEIIEKVRNDIGADFLGYNDAENLANAVGIPLDSMCFTCTSGNYEPLGIKPEFKTREQLKGDQLETAYVLVQCKIAHEMEILKVLLDIDNVKEAKGTFGYYDIFVKIQGEDNSSIEDILSLIHI